MPQGTYERTEKHRKKMSEVQKGHKVSEETRRKISEAGKGREGYWKGQKQPRWYVEKRVAAVRKNRKTDEVVFVDENGNERTVYQTKDIGSL